MQSDRATVTDAELQTLSSQLHSSDVNAVSGIVLNLQGKTTSGNTNDLAPQSYYLIVQNNYWFTTFAYLLNKIFH